MDSKSLKQYGFEKWHPLVKLSIGDLLDICPCVYAFRLEKESSKIQDIDSSGNLVEKDVVSDIIYFGETENILNRICKNFVGGAGGKTTKRIHNLLMEHGYLEEMEISWTVTDNHKELERDFGLIE